MQQLYTLRPQSGIIEGGAHRFAVRVFFEDTDLSGVVYHANYLRFFERARSDMLRVAGIDQRGSFDAGVGVYAVRDMALDYAAPARLDDALLIETRVTELRAATVTMAQRCFRGQTYLVGATVRAAFLTRDGRPRRQPAEWVARFAELMPAQG